MFRRYSHHARRADARRPIAAALAGLCLASLGLAACSSDDGPRPALQSFLDGWRGGDLNKVGFITADNQRIAANTVAEQIGALSGALRETPPALAITGEPKITKNLATAAVAVDWTLPGGGRWTYPTTVRLSQDDDGEWQVIWEPTIIQGQLTPGDQLALRRLAARRGAIMDAAGQPIVAPREVVVVGVTPEKIVDQGDLIKKLDAAFKSIDTEVDLADLPDRIKKADEGAFIDLVSLRRETYNRIRPQIRDLKGTVFDEQTRDLAPTRAFARALLGTVDSATKDDIDSSAGKYVAGDLVGHGGLQQRYDEALRGGVGQSVVIARKAPDGTVADTEVFRAEPRAGTPVRTTLDVATQNAADTALAGDKHRSALVAVRVSDGAVLAAANGPDGGGENLAFTAQVPPGSTFKMVSTLGLLDKGAVTADKTVPCPKTATVEGRSFKNSNDFVLGNVPFRTDFAKSCNTAFVALAPQLGPDGLAAAGTALGLGTTWNLGVDAFSGKVSTGGSGAERAAAAFGQGTTVVSPLAMAGATAAVARGQFQQPKLVLEPAPAAPAPAGPQLAATSVEPLRAMMRAVVTDGTATELKDVPGDPVHGKTGTAEFDNNPKNTHAWFVGWRGDVAFAVFVEKGGASSETAVPIAERFLRALPKS
ncbi:MAG TPA: penicillin-binding transpeptidase domain-containing protein [Catenuloplanes sp.]|jgi:cell division protein FtsI/penicillin-binding protein 2